MFIKRGVVEVKVIEIESELDDDSLPELDALSEQTLERVKQSIKQQPVVKVVPKTEK